MEESLDCGGIWATEIIAKLSTTEVAEPRSGTKRVVIDDIEDKEPSLRAMSPSVALDEGGSLCWLSTEEESRARAVEAATT